MKALSLIVSLVVSFSVNAQSEDYWELLEHYASTDAAKYYAVLKYLDEGNTKEAKEALLGFQSVELAVLEELRKKRGISEKSESTISLVEGYNASRKE